MVSWCIALPSSHLSSCERLSEGPDFVEHSVLSLSILQIQIADLAEGTEDLGASERATAGSKGGQEGALGAGTAPDSSNTAR